MGLFRVVHPFPSGLHAVAATTVALIAGAAAEGLSACLAIRTPFRWLVGLERGSGPLRS
jgi:hypothetical protein